MPFETIKTDVQGLEHLNKALDNLTDERGTKWRKQAFQLAGRKAMRPVLNDARRLAPRGNTGLTSQSLTTRSRYQPLKSNSRKFQREYRIYTTLNSAFGTRAYKSPNRKSAYRYPFALEVGVPPQTYTQHRNGKPVQVNRKAPRKPIAFQAKALGRNAKKVVNIFTGSLQRNVSLAVQNEYKTLPQALRGQRRGRR
ncbi:hypothetical protein VIBRN418_01633 [Vibrio sp. N418]|nr:hypothetical protein VIBRN418_01633 [Vibrio sp. N418]